ncbi:acyl-coenzyme A thioesterase 9, mitochondrial isoform X3 [Leptinotarsa decemlineata]|uniref:acyl-coenzyme A thioesterase 9, mitochondrial isoform X3 n=1 Tax=Leptinotarsa decemlineata TaxID=7539 RepID=UPI003D30A52E
MEDSFLAGIIPLSSDKVLQDKYVTFAVMVAHKHIVNPKQPPNEVSPDTLVTALVDFTDSTPKPQEEIRISGHVSWVGNSSLEVVVWLELRMHGTWNPVTRALFLLAARDSNNSKSTVVNAIQPANDREIQILSGGKDRKQRWVKLQQKHVLKVIPDSEEQKIIHDIFLRTVNNEISQRNRVLPPGCVWMNSASISNVVLSHPEERNMHNTVFGGFIMAQAEESSWFVFRAGFGLHVQQTSSHSQEYQRHPVSTAHRCQFSNSNAYPSYLHADKLHPDIGAGGDL